MTVAEDIGLEHWRVADTLETVGAEAPAGVGTWTAADLAAHLRSANVLAGLGVFVGRALVARGVHLTRWSGPFNSVAIRFLRRVPFNAAIEDLRAPVPRLLTAGRVGAVSLAEVWLHHDDLRRANALGPPEEPASLVESVNFTLRYQRRRLRATAVDRTASHGDLLRWLAGRPCSIPPHDPPLRF